MKNLAWRIKQGTSILSEYKGTPPLSNFLKDHFKKNKKFGRRDRSEIAQVLFSYFRMGQLSKQLPTEQAMALGFYLTNDCEPSDLVTINEIVQRANLTMLPSPSERLYKIQDLLAPDTLSILPLQELSEGIDAEELTLDFLSQHDTFLKVLKEKSSVLEELEHLGIPYATLGDDSISVPSNTKLDGLSSAQQGAFYIQDYSSQRVSAYMQAEPEEQWWDACAGGGGKSLLFLSRNPKTQLLGSDIRKASLSNYSKRLQHHGFGSADTKVINLAHSVTLPSQDLFDGIILDVPCTGSGTWARSPERALYFTNELIQHYVQKQQEILKHALPWLKPGGVVVYITCSVFKEENENQINRLCSANNFVVERSEMLRGFDYNADHLFVARLISPHD